MSILKVLGYIRIALCLVLPFAVLAEDTGQPGEEKKKMVVGRLKDELARLGLVLPEWLKKYEEFLLGVVVDVVVAILNRMGFFEHSGTSEPDLKPA
ncbi:MAG: hypothetical protein HPY71_01785 [Firmicutes bacterium]|nr:hypothetical protein [Bacillota bacterium]